MNERGEMIPEEKEIVKAKGFIVLFWVLAGFLVCTAGIIGGAFLLDREVWVTGGAFVSVSVVGCLILAIICGGFKVLNPKEALVLTLFGTYYGTIKRPGFFFVNPFCVAVAPKKSVKKKVSLKTLTLNNSVQKVNDALGNPIIIGAVVIWKVTDPTKAVFNVENFSSFLSIQCDSTIRKITRLYPYDLLEEEEDEESNEKTLRGSSQEIAESMKIELQQRVMVAGIEVEDVRITHLSYAEEIAAAMLQKQQAAAVIAARKKIVEGAVGMVQQAIDKLGEEEVVVLDEERKAAMVSNLLVVLCGNKDAQPIVNSGTIY